MDSDLFQWIGFALVTLVVYVLRAIRKKDLFEAPLADDRSVQAEAVRREIARRVAERAPPAHSQAKQDWATVHPIVSTIDYQTQWAEAKIALKTSESALSKAQTAAILIDTPVQQATSRNVLQAGFVWHEIYSQPRSLRPY